jgi:hypothetical protein
MLRSRAGSLSGRSINPSTASGDDAGFFKTEIAASARGWDTDNDMVHQVQLQDSASLENSPSKTQVSFRRRRVAAYAACGITGVIPHPVLCRIVTDFSKSGQRPDAA